MDIWRLLSAIIRRWYIIIPLLVATIAAAVTVGSWVRPEYKTSAIISVIPDKATAQPRAGQSQVANPYLSGAYTAGILEYVLGSSSVRQDLLATGFAGNYVIKAIPRTSFLGIDVTSDDPELALATGRGVIERARRILAERQGVLEGPTTRVLIDVLDDADAVSATASGQSQALAAVLAVGVIVSVIVTVLIDDLLLLRRRRDRAAVMEATPSSNGAVRAAVKPSHRAGG